MSTLLAAAGSLEPAARSYLSPTGQEIVFLLVGVLVLGAAVVSVTTRQLVHAALWLVVALGGLAVEFLLLTAEFVAWVQVLVYLGSVVVLVLFGLMLTRAPIGRPRTPTPATARPPSRSAPPPPRPWSPWSSTRSARPGSTCPARSAPPG